MLLYTLVPKGHVSVISSQMVYIVYCLENKLRIHAPYILCKTMIEAAKAKGPKKGLPFGILVTKLLEQFLVPIPAGCTVIKAMSPMCAATVSRMGELDNPPPIAPNVPRRPVVNS
ncbi:hypothetical protein L1049_010969 [Liquidambar formosana]|uniref:Uncharacterized protein n=2 Tax=Liquidambar formosana TaxID=63359 RepID=A0AAP0RRI3_LIQFO